MWKILLQQRSCFVSVSFIHQMKPFCLLGRKDGGHGDQKNQFVSSLLLKEPCNVLNYMYLQAH